MGQVGGNGSVVWQNQHQPKTGKFKCKDHTKLKRDELGLGNALDVWGHDEVLLGDIGATPAPGVTPGSPLDGFQKPGYFLVRLRFDGAEATAIESWFATGGTAVPADVKKYTEGTSTIVAFNIKAVSRAWPNNNITWTDLPFEIRYDW